MNWYLDELTGVDFETTGVDPQTDRIVSAAVVRCGQVQSDVAATKWLSDVDGMEIPAAATGVHGISTEMARASGRPAADVIEQIVDVVAGAVEAGTPIVVMNAAYDLTMLEREAERYGVKSLFARVAPCVIDPMVMDRQIDRYRPGKRTLTSLCGTYGVRLDGAHTADADAIAACRVARKIGARYQQVGGISPGALHALQVAWAAEQGHGLREYFARTPGKEHLAAGVRTDWPLIPAQRGGDGS